MSVTEPASEYEKARALVIARNRARLLALGVQDAAADLVKATEKPKKQQRKPKKEKRSLEETGASPPRRRSKRLRSNDENDAQDELPPEALELARFEIDGTCPRCDRVFTRGHAGHLENCSGKPEKRVVQLSIAELVQLEVEKIEKEDKKLSELELGGLIDVSEEEAVFMVVGSTGRHYKVKLSDKKRSCMCVDHRCRKHDCKHIRLLLHSLGIADDPGQWYEATKKSICQQAEAAAS